MTDGYQFGFEAPVVNNFPHISRGSVMAARENYRTPQLVQLGRWTFVISYSEAVV